MDMNKIMLGNINSMMKKQNKKQVELAEQLDVSRQIVNKMLSGARIINAIELKKIADFLDVEMDVLLTVYENQSMDLVKAFMGKVSSKEAEEGIVIADEIIDMILFQKKYHNNIGRMQED